MRTSTKLIVALATAGMAAGAGSAFTSSGIVLGGTASGAQFIGGTLKQTNINGAQVTRTEYLRKAEPVGGPYANIVEGINLTFTAPAAGAAVTVNVFGTTLTIGGVAAVSGDEVSCTVVDASTHVSNCTGFEVTNISRLDVTAANTPTT